MKIPLTKWEIDGKSFAYRGLKVDTNPYGVFMVVGRQGSGKTYYAVDFLNSLVKKHKNLKIYTNVNSLKFKHEFFQKISEIVENTEENVIFLIDEVSRKYNKNSKQDQFYSFLQQSRKRKRIVIMITQEWLETPMWLRRPVDYIIGTRPTKFLGIFNIFTICTMSGKDVPYNSETGEYEPEPLKYRISKRNKKIAELYDTFEPINEL